MSVETTEATEVKAEPTFSSPMQKMQYDGLVEFIQQHNELVGKANAASGDAEALADQIAANEFPDEVAEIERLQAELDAKVDAKVQEALSQDQGDVTELQEQAKEIRSKIGAGINYYKKLYGDESAEAFPKIERLKGARVGGSGTGGRRVRGFRVVVTEGGEVTEYDNFASAAKALGLETKELQEQFFAKAGAEKLADVPNEVTWTLNWVEEDGNGNETPASADIRAYRETPNEEAATEPAVAATEDAEPDEVEDDLDLTEDDGTEPVNF